jgi:hypothetical protein
MISRINTILIISKNPVEVSTEIVAIMEVIITYEA